MNAPVAVSRSQLVVEAQVSTTAWFLALSSDLQELVLQTARLRLVETGSTYGYRGAVPTQCAVVVQGVLAASGYTTDGRASSYLLARSTQWVDCDEAAQGIARMHNIVAISDCVILVIDAPVFRRLLHSSVKFCGFVIEQISQQHRRLLERLERERCLSKAMLVAHTVAELASELGNQRHGSVELRQEHIAEFVGISRQTVNQVLKKLEAEGLLRTRYGRVEIADVDALQSFSFKAAVDPIWPSRAAAVRS